MFAPQTRAAYLLLIPSTGCYFGTPVPLHQKQPLTKIAVLYLRITMSGLPGTLLTFSLYRYPCAHSHFLTVISGFVALLRICDMQRRRCAGVRTSGILLDKNRIYVTKCGINESVLFRLTEIYFLELIKLAVVEF